VQRVRSSLLGHQDLPQRQHLINKRLSVANEQTLCWIDKYITWLITERSTSLRIADGSSSSWQVRTLCPVLPHLPQRRKVDNPASDVPPSANLLPDCYLPVSFSSIKTCPSSIVSATPARRRVRLALRRFERASS
jgi:hypothetical protein